MCQHRPVSIRSSRGMTWLLGLPLLTVVAGFGCKKNEHNMPPLVVAPAPADATVGGIGNPVEPPPAGPPPGTAELFQVPAEIAAKVKLERIATGLARPVFLTTAPGDARRRLFIVLQHVGEIRTLENGKLSDKPFFKIGNLSTSNEQGLLGLAFHPKFAENGKLYVNYTSADDATHIVEYKIANADAVDMKSAREIVKIDQPYSNHNGGMVAFGPDGKLWTGMGDGGAANDPHKNGQNPQALLGKILEFDVDDPKSAASILHLGVRNPWRFSFDGDNLYIGDVGQNLWENVYVIATKPYRKHNFGWNVVEGNHCFMTKKGDACDREAFTAPAADYPHEQGCSVTGGYVYRGKALPALVGRYFYADYCTGLLRSFRWTPGGTNGYVRDHWEWKPAIDKQAQLAEISSFGIDADGELYILELTGAIFRLSPN